MPFSWLQGQVVSTKGLAEVSKILFRLDVSVDLVTVSLEASRLIRRRNIHRKHYTNHTKHILCLEPECSRARPGKGFASKKDMEQHTWVVHPKLAVDRNFGSPSTQCNLCGTRLRRKDYLKRHLKSACPFKDRGEGNVSGT